MYRIKKTVNFVVVLTLISFGNIASAVPIFINLNDFFADPEVTVAVDGSSASFVESPFFSPILLSNDPGLGDPNVIIPDENTALIFDYDFMVGSAGDDDEFGAFLLDGDTGTALGPEFNFFTDSSSSGSVSFDLSSLEGSVLGLQIQLTALPDDEAFGSTLTISNLRLEAATPIPEPSTIYSFLLGSLLLLLIGRRVR